MTKKILICLVFVVTLINVCAFSNICFAANDEKSINLGNEITKSMDKTADSVRNVVSGNVIYDAAEGVKNTAQNAKNVVEDGADAVKKEERKMESDANDSYNARRTTAEATETGIDKDRMTTWMWLTLIAATTIIIAAIWYYVTQVND